MQIASFWPATCTHMAQESGGPLSVTLEARQIGYVNGEREKSGARLDCFCFGIHKGIPADSFSGEHSRPKSASPPSQPPVFPGLPPWRAQQRKRRPNDGKRPKHVGLEVRSNVIELQLFGSAMEAVAGVAQNHGQAAEVLVRLSNCLENRIAVRHVELQWEYGVAMALD